MGNFLIVLQLVSSILLIIVILMQQKGSGLSGMFGGSNDIYRTKRGAEKFLFRSTIVLATIFLGAGVLALVF
ncbi:MAG: preprotein translocase subunit SecG [Xanthomonadaceae bacterium]|nr:preprotein translocase subunit SecG [Rhodospirillaceae bacterium]NIA17845.1 preprotein translocase subunit SecG [Xanthomonadaceae bacterium]